MGTKIKIKGVSTVFTVYAKEIIVTENFFDTIV